MVPPPGPEAELLQDLASTLIKATDVLRKGGYGKGGKGRGLGKVGPAKSSAKSSAPKSGASASPDDDTDPDFDTTNVSQVPRGSRTCPICQQVFSSHQRAQGHLDLKHSGKSEFNCLLCKKPLATQQNLINHLARMHGSQKYQCHLCPLMFRSRDNLILHLNQNRDHKKLFKAADKEDRYCRYCLQFFKSNDHMKAHKRMCKLNPHKPTQMYPCLNAGCPSQFNQIKHRNYHSKTKCKFRKRGG